MVCWTTPQRVADPVAMRVAVNPLPQLQGPRWLSNHEGGDHSRQSGPREMPAARMSRSILKA